MKKIDILDCTLRDGSYVINYQFTAKDTAVISLALENAGLRYIEIGHGLGLNASSSKGKAAGTDQEYLKTAHRVLTKSKFGMFFIPGIGRKKDLDLAAHYGMGFVRIGTDVTRIKEAKDYIIYAKKLGMMVSSNLMKSYAVAPDEFAKKAKIAEEFGADIVVLVDSAGGMLPGNVKEYINALKEEGIKARIGFHGHNNLSMAIANTLQAIESGADMVDSTLMGIGRSSGNAATEILATILKKQGDDCGADIFKTMDIAEELIGPIIKTHLGTDPIAITSGYAEFHSSFLSTIYTAAKKYSIDPRKLIISACEKNKVNIPEELAMNLAKQLHKERAALSEISKIDLPVKFKISKERWNNKLSLKEKSRMMTEYAKNLAIKSGKQTIFVINISAVYDEFNMVFPYIYETSSYLMANCEMTSKNKIEEIVEAIDGLVDFIVVDSEKKRANLHGVVKDLKRKVRKSVILTYMGDQSWVKAIDAIVAVLRESLFGVKVGIVGQNNASTKLAVSLAEKGAKVLIYGRDIDDRVVESLNTIKIHDSPFQIKKAKTKKEISFNTDILIGLDRDQKIDAQMVNSMAKKGLIIDAIFGSVAPYAIGLAKQHGIKLLRVDMKAAMAGEMTTILRTYAMSRGIERSQIDGIPVVLPTSFGDKGDVVVDSILSPTEVIGISDGKGGVLYYGSKHKKVIDRIQAEIMRKGINGKARDSNYRQGIVYTGRS